MNAHRTVHTRQAKAPQLAKESLLSSRKWRKRIGHTIAYLLLLSGFVVIMVPLGWTLSTSLKTQGDIFVYPPQWLPSQPQWGNYVQALTVAPFGLYFENTAIITFLSILGKVVSCSLVAFSFARLRWWGRDVLFVVMLSTLMLPPQVTLIPHFIVFRYLGWIDTFLPLVVPQFFGGPFFIFLLRQFFLGISREIDDAARIDGASTFDIFARITIPLSMPALAAVAIFVFNSTWNEFLGPLIYLQTESNYTISLGLQLFQSDHNTDWNLLMAASTVAMLPVLVMFFAAQRYFIQGVVFTGLKG